MITRLRSRWCFKR
jgi:hypothetical protein